MASLEIFHCTHPLHPLVMTNKNSAYKCDLCQLISTGSRYHCTICDFDLHEHCVAYPASISTPLHSKHSLFLVLNKSNIYYCDSCGKQAKGCTYRCHCCNFDLHPSCTGFLQMKPQPSSTAEIEQNLAAVRLEGGTRSAYPTAGNFTGAVYGTGSSFPSNTSSHLGSFCGAVTSNIPNYGQGYLNGSTYSNPPFSFTGAESSGIGRVFVGAVIRHAMKEAGWAIGKEMAEALFSDDSCDDNSFDF